MAARQWPAASSGARGRRRGDGGEESDAVEVATVERKKEVRAGRGRVGGSEFRSPETGDKTAERVRMGVIGVVVVESVVSWGQRVTSRELRRTQHGQPPAASGEEESERQTGEPEIEIEIGGKTASQR